VRENGGQYAHAAVWALMAQARLACQHPTPTAPRERPYRTFTWLSPAHRSSHPAQRAAYGLEPYAMAGDICSQPPYVGRGGWSWYTGAAAWMHRAAIESIFGLRLGARDLSFMPCLPPHWPQAELTLRRDDRTLRFILMRASPADALLATAPSGAQLLAPGQSLHWTTLAPQSCFVIPLPPN
jgi:cyclic beta-1,2-glucan synthetase